VGGGERGGVVVGMRVGRERVGEGMEEDDCEEGDEGDE
jgi:hypothetical protein